MKKLACFVLCAVLLLTGCGNLSAGKETTAATESLRAPGWSVETVETGATTATGDGENADHTDEEGFVSDNELEGAYGEVGEEGESTLLDTSEGSGGTGATGGAPAVDSVLASRRNTVEAEMREMMSVLWTPAKTFTYYIDKDSPITLYADRIYQGIPYTHGGGSCYSFLEFATSKSSSGVYTLSGLTPELLSYQTSTARIGNDCADAIFWAWGQVSNSISFTGTKYMTESQGCLKVGDYTFSGVDYSGVHTAKVCEENGEQTMFACYGQMRKGDGMVMITSSGAGHAVMAVSVNVVRDADGEIDGQASYAVILEQTSTLERDQKSVYNAQVGAQVYLLEELDKKWTFDELFKKGYLPITCKELVENTATAKASVSDSISGPSLDNLFSGTLTGTHKISHVTITITDSSGKTLQQATCFNKQQKKNTFDINRFDTDTKSVKGTIDISKLASGTYTCTYTCQVSTGEIFTVRQFTFAK